ncbi:glycoprotein-N-acetylgalactosamine 3-beta-galactosyltransferase 1-like isoform X3 [Pomacea canaliculata]|nr:glycoprotein-N-acetylgalactosamine 3-beta-galactosyltransferase 1-like isoform X3 [Pomacea canaliculata]XP_025093753.1 glycoprotein-N-acetylgalactosamine 3-beta-galactosyltransferase 1-like isoform X3 [Pomacea canaliculata]XP_025093754.1 glycoprotein-N-acetylgalactosamine 3-beta-galactosyltransferase 1-like isoform X3 [Pomacea canaliculata]
MAAQKQFLLGILVGLTVAFVISGYHMLSQTVVRMEPHVHPNFVGRPSGVIGDEAFQRDDHEAWDRSIERQGPGIMLDIHDEHAHHDDVSEARRLAKEVRVLVWVMTAPKNLQNKARVVRDTWGKRSNKLLFFSSETDKNFPTIGLNVSEGREHLTAKTMNGFRYVYEHHLDDADWFMKVDDDTYVIVENLRYFLSNEDTREPVWFGHHFKTIVKQGYYSGGGGYVLSKEALKRLYEKGSDPNVCRQDGGAEDAELGRCMETLGVRTSNTSDVMGRSRFHCFDPETFLFGGYPDWYYQYDTNGARKGIGTMSDYSITFHYVSPEKMQALEFYIYHLNPYGIINGRQNLNRAPFKSQKVQPTRR